MHKHHEAVKTVKIASGQIQSVLKMLEEGRYCMDISTQIQATIALLKKAQTNILGEHLKTCVMESIEKKDAEHKIDEINIMLKSLLK